jgi:uncharacterized protein
MKTGPLNESELEWLDDILTKYNTDHAILDVAELDGLLTAVLSSPQEIEPAQWLVAVWGGADYVPRWASEKEMTRFMNLAKQKAQSSSGLPGQRWSSGAGGGVSLWYCCDWRGTF